MNTGTTWLITGLMLSIAPLTGCAQKSTARVEAEHPAQVDRIEGSELSRLTLTETAMKRLDVRTSKVSESPSRAGGAIQLAVPYGAVLYDPHGKTWVYTSPQPRTFLRQPIEVDYIRGDVAYLVKGPSVGVDVAVVGVAELYGTELKVGH